VRYEDVTLEKGLSMNNSFEEWANAVVRLQSDPGSVSGFKRTIFIDVFDLKGNPTDRQSQPIASYKLNRCWITKYTALPELDASSGGVGIQSVTLRHEGWERVI
jgi:phage tail-like protein